MTPLSTAMANAAEKKPANLFGSVEVLGHTLAFNAAKYAHGNEAPLALFLVVIENGEPVEPWCDLTKCVPGERVASDEVIVKMYDENEVLREPLLAAGYFEDTGMRTPAGFANLQIWRMTPDFIKLAQNALDFIDDGS
jgi:hypothetical protein